MNKYKGILSAFYLVIFFASSFFLFNFIKKSIAIFENEISSHYNEILNPQIEKQNKITNIYFVGDIMLTRGVESSVNKNFEGDYNKLFENVKELKNADILFGNLEGPISDKGNNVGSKYSFRMNPLVLIALKNTGFDILSFANNHIGDWNRDAFTDTLKRLDEENILKTGAGLNKKEAETPTIIEKNGIKFGFLGFSDVGPNHMEAKNENPGILLASDPNFEKIIENAKKESDVLIISFHFGEEYKTIHNKRQEELSHKAIDHGADIIIGHHPHVAQDIEWYKEKPIIYSLGNFIFDQHFSKETMKGMVFSMSFEGKKIKETKKFISILNKKYQIAGIYNEEEALKREEVLYSLCPKPQKKYENMFLYNLNQKNKLPEITYIPENLVELGKISTKEDICLLQEAKNSLSKMIADAEKENIKIKITSAYRSYNYQENLLSNAIKNGNKNASTSIAKAGHSEHQLGTAIDVSGESIGYNSAISDFGNTIEDFWMRENAHNYGFIMSYPEGKEKITGYIYEPWHYRYVGIPLASEIKKSGLTLTEYLK